MANEMDERECFPNGSLFSTPEAIVPLDPYFNHETCYVLFLFSSSFSCC